MSADGFRDRIWRSIEGTIDPFQDTDREVLPEDAWRFILYFANQAKGAFVLLLITGGLAGAVDAAMYWSVGWLIDLLAKSSPASAVFRPLARALPACCSSSLSFARPSWSLPRSLSNRSWCRGSIRWCAGRLFGALSSSPTGFTRTILPAESPPRSCKAERPLATS